MGHLQTRETFPNKKKTPPNKKNAFQARKIPSKTRKNTFRARETPFKQQEKYFSSKETSFKQGVGVFRQGKAVVSDGRYGVIGGSRYCLLVWGDAEETKGKRGRRWRGVGPAGRPSPFPFCVSVILKI